MIQFPGRIQRPCLESELRGTAYSDQNRLVLQINVGDSEFVGERHLGLVYKIELRSYLEDDRNGLSCLG
jgi:hypothetical protein